MQIPVVIPVNISYHLHTLVAEQIFFNVLDHGNEIREMLECVLEILYLK